MNKYPTFQLLVFVVSIGLLLSFPTAPAHAANCDGLPATSGALAAGTYTLTDNCVITGTFNITSGTVTINGGGFAIDRGGSYRTFYVMSGATLELNNVTVRNGITSFSGGAIFNNFGGTVTISNSTLSGNSATDYGGAIYNAGMVTINNSTLSGNSAGFGGAIYNFGTVTISNSTLSGNSATTQGGAIYNGVTVDLTNTIISANTAPSGGNCNNSGTITDNGGNLEDANDCGLSSGANTDPLLGAFNGSYYPLQAGSPAIDAAPTCPLSTDQIGTPRPQGSACDIGAIEYTTNPAFIPAPPACNLIEDVVAPDLPDGVYCRVLMRAGSWVANPGSVPAPLASENTILAVDVFRVTGQTVQSGEFGAPIAVCLPGGEGRLIFLDATTSPRAQSELSVFYSGGNTCGYIPNAGTLVLIP